MFVRGELEEQKQNDEKYVYTFVLVEIFWWYFKKCNDYIIDYWILYFNMANFMLFKFYILMNMD